METTIRTSIARRTSEIERLEQSKKSHLRMITSAATKLRMKYGIREDQKKPITETEARKIRMYETHNPGFCYLRNGEYRKKSTNNSISSTPDPTQCSEKIKAILFTDNELDIYKTVCLHLLATHVHNKNYIQRKDGRLCSYVKVQVADGLSTLQPMTQRSDTYVESPTKYDKMLPRYILDVKLPQRGISAISVRTADLDSGSDDETKKKRKLLVPIFINNEIRIIINSVMEALEDVESSKLEWLIELASSPEELRDLVAREEMQEFIIELARNPLIMKPTSYDIVMSHLMFDKIPDQGTLETVTQVLEIFDDIELKNSLQQIRRGIFQRYAQLTKRTLLQHKKACEKVSNPVAYCPTNSSIKFMNNIISGMLKPDLQEDSRSSKLEVKNAEEDENKTSLKPKLTITSESENALSGSSVKESENGSDDESYQQHRASSDTIRGEFHNLTNSQRILLGLKVASLKSRPINMHQFEGKKKVDLSAILSPIIRPQVSDVDYKQNSPENRLRNFALPERKVKKSVSSISTISTADLENLSRALLAHLRLQISNTENKKKVNQFMAKF